MSYRELKEFNQRLFKEKARDILDKSLRETGITDIDGVSDEKKLEFAKYMLKTSIMLDPLTNRKEFETLLRILNIRPMQNAAQYRSIVKETGKPEKDLILASFESFWTQVEEAYSKFEILINVFWLKAIEAEESGKDKRTVEGIVRKAVIDIRHDVHQAYLALLEDLYLQQFLKKAHFKAEKIFDNLIDDSAAIRPDPQSARIIACLSSIMAGTEKMIASLEALLLQSIQGLSKQGRKPDEAIIRELKRRVTSEWSQLCAVKEKEFALLHALAAEQTK